MLVVGRASGVIVLSDLVVGLLLSSGVMVPNSSATFRAIWNLLS